MLKFNIGVEILFKFNVSLVFRTWSALMGFHMSSPEGKLLPIDKISQNRLNTIKNHEFWSKIKKKCSSVLGILLEGATLKTKI